MASDYTSKFSEKYGQLSGADLEILGAREQAATARALRTAFKPAQGQMVGGWYVRPALTQNLADALMQYNNYQDEQSATKDLKTLRTARQKAADDAYAYEAAAKPAQPAYDREVTPASTITVNPEDQATTREPQKFFTGEPAPTPNGTQAYVPPTAEATGNINKNPTNNRYTTHLPTDAQELTASDNMPLANAVRNAPLDNTAPGADLAADINSPTLTGGTASAPAEQTLPTITTTAPREVPQESPANNEATARILRGENPFDARPARVENIAAVTEHIPAVPSNFDQRTFMRMLAKAGLQHEADRELKDIETQSTNEQHRLSTNATIAGHTADNIQTNLRYALTEANRLADKKEQAQAIAEAKVEAAQQTAELTKWKVKADNETKLTVANIGAEVRKDVLTQGKLSPGQRFKEGTNEVELIPGTTQYLKAKNDHATDIAARDTIVGINQHVTKSIDKLLNSTGFDKIFGIIGGNTFNWSDDAKAAATARNQVVGALETAGLAINKQASGAIGSMAVSEWPKMATYAAVIKNSDNPKDVRDALVGAKEVLARTASIANGKYTNEYGGGQFDTSRKASSAPSGGSDINDIINKYK